MASESSEPLHVDLPASTREICARAGGGGRLRQRIRLRCVARAWRTAAESAGGVGSSAAGRVGEWPGDTDDSPGLERATSRSSGNRLTRSPWRPANESVTRRTSRRPPRWTTTLSHGSAVHRRQQRSRRTPISSSTPTHRCNDWLTAPELGERLATTNPRLQHVRVWPVQKFRNFLIFYREVPEGIKVVRVLHGARNWQAILGA